MGKEGEELWDDSALIKAFDSAISKYKVMHDLTQSTSLPLDQTNQHVQDDSGRVVPTDDTLQILENPASELGSAIEHVGSSNNQNGSLPPNNGSAAAQSGQPEKHVVASDVNSQNEYTWTPNDQEEYSQLWSKYYEVEDQRQKIIQQLNQYGDWNYQTYATDTHPSEEHKEYVPEHYETVTCHCPYGCQNLVLPCTSVPDSCLGGACTSKDCTIITEGVRDGTSMSKEEPDFVKTAMDAAERALSSLMKQDYSKDNTSANGGKNNELGVEIDHVTGKANSATDLSMVLNAWFSAGFYTGKYLSEQSFEKKKHR